MRIKFVLRGAVVLPLLLLSPGSDPAIAGGGVCDGQGNATLEILADGAIPAPGSRFRMRLTARAGASVAVVGDLGAGPTMIPGVGTLCVDRGPFFRVLLNGLGDGSVTVPASGMLDFDLEVPPLARLAGRVYAIQAVVADDQAPNGFAISNKVDALLRQALLEDFTTTDNRDDATTTARWDGDGTAVGRVAPPRTIDFEPTATVFLLPQPLVSNPNGSRFQMLYRRQDLDIVGGESIVGMSWGPQSNFVFGSRYQDVTMKLGYLTDTPVTSLRPRYDRNYTTAPGNPVTVFDGDYQVATSITTEWEAWPSFLSDFEYPGRGSVVFEVELPSGGDTFQLFRNRSTAASPRRRNFSRAGVEVAPNPDENTQYHTRFEVALTATCAQSILLDSGVEDPDWFTPRAILLDAPPGTSVELQFEGADDTDGDGVPDEGTLTGLVTDIDALDGSRFLRFKAILRGDFRNGQVPTLQAVAFPFE